MSSKKYVVIGGDAAGMSAASQIKRRQPDAEVIAFEMGSYTSYSACGMPYYVGGDVHSLDDLVLISPREFGEKRGIQVFPRHLAEHIDVRSQMVVVRDLDAGRSLDFSYDALLIATGAEPNLPKGLDSTLKGVFVLRGLPDAADLKRYIQGHSVHHAVIVGSGYIGMEMAEALRVLGLNVTIVGRRPRILPGFEPEIGSLVAEELSRRDIKLITGAEAADIKRSGNGRLLLICGDGLQLDTDIVILGAGVRPRSELAAEAGIALGVKNAIRVDRYQKTSHPHVWAAGDCAEAWRLVLGRNDYIPLALTANRQGRIAGRNMIGDEIEFPGMLGTAICKVFDLTVAKTGLNLNEAVNAGFNADKVEVNSRSRAGYYPGSAPIRTVVIFDAIKGKVLGAQMTGQDGVAHRINTWVAAITAGFTLEQVHNMDLAYAPPFSQVWDPVLIAGEVAMKKMVASKTSDLG